MEAINMMEAPKDVTIADTCVLVVWNGKKISTTRRADKATEERVRRDEGDDSITVNRHLFQKGEVKDLLALMDKGYDEHMSMTAAWADKGPRILPGTRFDDYARMAATHIATVEDARIPVIQNWDRLVMEDISRRSHAGQKGVSIDQYPDRYQIQRAFVITWRPMPIADHKDFRVAIPEYAKEKHREYVQSAVGAVRNDLLTRLLTPISKAVERLSIPIGEKHSTFKDTLVNNLRDAVNEVRDLNVGGDPDIADIVTSLEALLAGGVTQESLRTQQQHRNDTAAKLAQISKQFAGLV